MCSRGVLFAATPERSEGSPGGGGGGDGAAKRRIDLRGGARACTLPKPDRQIRRSAAQDTPPVPSRGSPRFARGRCAVYPVNGYASPNVGHQSSLFITRIEDATERGGPAIGQAAGSWPAIARAAGRPKCGRDCEVLREEQRRGLHRLLPRTDSTNNARSPMTVPHHSAKLDVTRVTLRTGHKL